MLLTHLDSKAQLKLIHYWDFNSTATCGAAGVQLSPLHADYSSLKQGVIVYNQVTKPLRDSIFDDAIGGSSINVRTILGNDTSAGTCHAGNIYVRTRNPSSEEHFDWYIPTSHYKNIMLTYATERSGSGPLAQVYSYSLDSGLTFSTAGFTAIGGSLPDSTVVTANWAKVQLDLSSLTSVNNNSKFVFRVMTSGQNTATNGNDRYDNITVEGDTMSVTGIASLTDNAFGYKLYPNPANSNVTVVSTEEGTKVVEVRNLLGQTLSVSQVEGKQFQLSVNALNSGIYFVNVTEKNTGVMVSLKLIKN